MADLEASAPGGDLGDDGLEWYHATGMRLLSRAPMRSTYTVPQLILVPYLVLRRWFYVITVDIYDADSCTRN